MEADYIELGDSKELRINTLLIAISAGAASLTTLVVGMRLRSTGECLRNP